MFSIFVFSFLTAEVAFAEETASLEVRYTTSDRVDGTSKVLSGVQRTPVKVTFWQQGAKLESVSRIILKTKASVPAQSVQVTSAFVFTREISSSGNQLFESCPINQFNGELTVSCTVRSGNFDYLRLTIEPVGALPNPGLLFLDRPFGITVTSNGTDIEYHRSLSFEVIDRPVASPIPPGTQTVAPSFVPTQSLNIPSGFFQNFPSSSHLSAENLMPQFKTFLASSQNSLRTIFPTGEFPLGVIFYQWVRGGE